MEKESWVAMFVAELSLLSMPPVPAKFAHAIALQRWLTHADQAPDEVGRVWFEARRSSIGTPPLRPSKKQAPED